MQANLFKLLAIAAAFSAVHSAPVETAEVTKAQVNGTQVNGLQINGTQINDSFRVAGSRKPAIRGTSLISAKEERREIFSSGLAGAKPAGTTISALLGDVGSAICTLTPAATHGLLAGSVEV
ncbi:hypothetical protein NEUTE1DRAFT_117179 [Neurospora tetrasperma FGSC 2508]|uniref:Uncharacterized protein n=1 Tax=Neurospora tetrasperma (strain FGSC 2508 / ATCC MYA-4615 / P0657) TaxID=510951 RepID=F8MLZ9_NEUT8|nr:uncharacterized protein NEUTE1DRAFT_117179 [Neurospora tetrasperma FGSC 2508]EGO58514.1 hypothetical protein NEUTE1DRAFT_117179 [Neurospora tetrasperma FGSC 2508]EGZ71145.1 hypothetical protein NEUTE2DRAFT_144430 [Neurospora tetrasperma FGSC 2509]